MAQITFNQIDSTNSSPNNNFKVGFFSLKNDGDEAIVRIMHDNTASFELLTTHPVEIDGKYRKVNCIRNPRDPMENCPICKAGGKVQSRMFLHLIQYVKDDNGNIIPQGKVWERPASYAVTVKNLIDEYGPLSDCIFKIRRNGEAGSRNTTYTILYGNPQIYRSELYPKDETIFEGYTALGSSVMDKNFDELAEFISTGSFPQKNENKGVAVEVTEKEFVTPRNAPNTNNSVPRPTRYY